MGFPVAPAKRLPKPLVWHLGRQSNSLNFKAEERAQRRLDRLLFTARIERPSSF